MAVNEGVAFAPYMGRRLRSMQFQGGVSGGSALTAGQRLVIRDTGTPGTGNILVDYLTEGTSDNASFTAEVNGRIVQGLAIDNNTIGGTWVVTAQFEG
jgi:hypothetical protein